VIGTIRPAAPVPVQWRCALAGALALLLLGGLLCAAWAQSNAPDWPGTKPIRFEVVAAPGGLVDIVPRTLSNSLAASIGVPVVVENRPGAGGNVAAAVVARAEPDGHTLLVTGSNQAVNPTLLPNPGFDYERDLAPVSMLVKSKMLLVASPSFPANTIADVIALAIKPNLHASGITVLEEATICGVPVICTDTGGLRAYFSDREVKYVPPHQPDALRHEIAALAKDGDAGPSMVEQARARMISAGLSSRRFAQRHAELSRELLGVPETSRASPPMRERNSVVPLAERSLRSGLWALKGAAMLCAAAGIVAVAVLAGGGPLSSQVRAAGDRIDLCAFRPTFTEDFNSLSVSPWGENGSRWIAHTPWHGDFGDAVFTDPQADFPFRVGKGILEIEARKNPDGKWQSGLLASATPSTAGFAQQFGYFETRAQLPPGPGVWPAFWLDSNQPQGSQKPGVEIDVLEYYGQFTNAYHSSVHVWEKIDPTKSRVEDHITEVPAGSLSSAFHTYGVDVEPDWITFYLDRREIWRVATPPELQDPLMVLVNLALGSGWPIDQTPNPSVMLIDYVHVYRPLAKGEKPVCATSGGGTGSLEIIRR